MIGRNFHPSSTMESRKAGHSCLLLLTTRLSGSYSRLPSPYDQNRKDLWKEKGRDADRWFCTTRRNFFSGTLQQKRGDKAAGGMIDTGASTCRKRAFPFVSLCISVGGEASWTAAEERGEGGREGEAEKSPPSLGVHVQ